MVPVLVGDDGGAFGGTVAHGEGEADALQEVLHFAVEGCAADDDFVEAAAEGLYQALADFVEDAVADERELQQDLHARRLEFGEHVLLDDLFNDERNGDDDGRLDVGKGLHHDFRRGDAGEVIDVAPVEELEDEFEGHAVHVGHGEHGNDAVAALHLLAEHFDGELVVGPDGAVGNHDTLGVGRGAAGVVDEGKVVGCGVVGVVDEFLAEEFGVLFSEELVEALAGFGELFGARNEERVVGDAHDAFEVRHGIGVELGPDHIAGKEDFRFGVVHNVVNLGGLELVEDGYGHCAVAEDSHEGCGPVGAVASAKGDAVAALDTRVFEENVELLNLAGNILILEGDALVIGQCVEVPVVLEAFSYQPHKIGISLHDAIEVRRTISLHDLVFAHLV